MSDYALRTSQSGRAVIGLISGTALDEFIAKLKPLAELKKPAESEADFHHPGAYTVIRVKEGSHTIIVTLDSGDRKEITLEVGDRVLFADFKPKQEPEVGRSGHASKAGPSGVTLERWECDLSWVGWQPL